MHSLHGPCERIAPADIRPSDVQPDLDFLLGFRLEIFQLDRADGRKMLRGIHAEVSQKLLRRSQQNRAPRRVQSSEFLDYFGIPHDDARIVPVRVENAVAFAYLDEGEFVAKRPTKIGVVRSGGGLDEEAFPTIQAAYLWLQDNTKETLTYQSLLKACHAGCGYKGFDWRLAGE